LQVTDEDFATAAECFEINPPPSKEAYFTTVFIERQFPSLAYARTVPGGTSIACSSPAAIAWGQGFALAVDPSDRSVWQMSIRQLRKGCGSEWHRKSYGRATARKVCRSFVQARGLGAKELGMAPEETVAASFPVECAFQCRSRREVCLGPVRIDVRSNEADFKGFRFFAEPGRAPAHDAELGSPVDFTLSLCNLHLDAPWPFERLSLVYDRTYRGKKMVAGYYLTDHFGAPAYLVSRGTRYWIFAENFEPILWPYAVKHLLTVYAMEHNMVHLKAAGVVVDGCGTLLVGRGGSGKTVLLNHLCRAGGRFLSNTHSLLDGNTVIGISTAMRVRKDEFFTSVIEARGLSPSVKAGEYVVDPCNDLGWQVADSAPVRSVCLLDYKGSARTVIREIERDTMFDYMEQFAHAINVYGLKEDMLDHLGGDVERFSIQASRMRAQLRALIGTSRCYYVSCDVADARNLQMLRNLLSAG
jgi:hypothetical protein